MYTEEMVKEITTDLYYDLLEKYVHLKAMYDGLLEKNAKMKDRYAHIDIEIMELQKHTSIPMKQIQDLHNKQIKQYVKIVHELDKHSAIMRLCDMKIKIPHVRPMVA